MTNRNYKQDTMEQSMNTNTDLIIAQEDVNRHRSQFRNALSDIHYLEQCRGCARTIKHDWVFVPRHISKYDHDRRMYHTFCCEECYEEVSWRESYIDERTGNLFVWDNALDKYVVYNAPGKFYP